MLKIPVSVGELIDKLSILEIKKSKITDPDKLVFINKEFLELSHKAAHYFVNAYIIEKYKDLLEINTKLWEVEDKLRIKEKLGEFNDDFIFLARQVYIFNDLRFAYKDNINVITNSDLQEVKEFSKK